MDRTKVDSKTLASVGYRAGVLELEFTKSGEVYRYAPVPEEVYQGLLTAESKGRYFGQHIRSRYSFVRMASAKSR